MYKFMFLDLDNTIMFSKSKSVAGDKCVGYKMGKPTDFMNTNILHKIIANEEENNSTYIIPVTSRSKEQFARTCLFDICRYSLTTNGGNLIVKGKVSKEWESETYKLLGDSTDKVYDIFREINTKCSDSVEFCRITDGMFMFIKSSDPNEIRKFEYSELCSGLEGISCVSNKTKLTFTPKNLNKGIAVERMVTKLRGTLNIDRSSCLLVGAGDSEMDIPMLNNVDTVICTEEIAHAVKCSSVESTKDRLDKLIEKHL